jgi:arylformamidase
MKINDISQELFSCNVYPGDTPPTFDRIKTVESDKYNLTNISMCVHNGIYIDAPCHFITGGKSIDELDLSVFYGTCAVAEFSGLIDAKAIAPLLESCAERLLLKGKCEISDETAKSITATHVRLIGVESQSVGNADAPMSVHLILLGAGVIPLEELNLKDIAVGEYTLAAFPINMKGSDGSPVMAVLLRE